MDGKNKRGRPKRRWADDQVDWCNNDICTLHGLAKDRRKLEPFREICHGQQRALRPWNKRESERSFLMLLVTNCVQRFLCDFFGIVLSMTLMTYFCTYLFKMHFIFRHRRILCRPSVCLCVRACMDASIWDVVSAISMMCIGRTCLTGCLTGRGLPRGLARPLESRERITSKH